MSIMSRRGTKSARVCMPTLEDEVDDFVRRQRSRAAKNVEGIEAPIKAVEPQMLGQPIRVFILARIERLNVSDVLLYMEANLIRELRDKPTTTAGSRCERHGMVEHRDELYTQGPRDR